MRQLFIGAVLAASGAVAQMPHVEWQTLGNCYDNGKPTYTQRFTITGAKGVGRICFNQFARKMKTVNPVDTIMEIVPGYYYLASPRLVADGTAVIDVVTNGTLRHASYMPDGFHGVSSDGNLVAVKTSRCPIDAMPELWSLPGNDLMPSAEAVYERNESLKGGRQPGAFDIIPSLKNVILVGAGFANMKDGVNEKVVKHHRPCYYKIDFSLDTPLIEYASPKGRIAAWTTLQQILTNNPQGVPRAVVEDWPDYSYRGVMIDIARNFIGIADLQRVAQYMARYKMNKLHFHFADDEAWRLEIPGLPELTAVGSRRGYTLDEDNFLAQIFTGNGNPDSSEGTANGYITRGEFIQFLRYCASLGIDVIPEIESPGHARAAIKAMRHRHKSTGDDSYLLSEEGDTSVYTSAQSFHDNVMNPALPGPYRFMEKVIDEIKSMYDDAGVALVGLHIGGDEVPRDAWGGSASAQTMISSRNLDGEKGLHAAFVKKVAAMLSARGIPMNGWQEIAIGHSAEYDNEIAPLTGGVNFWRESRRSEAPGAAAAGYPVIVCNVDHFYLDQAYSNHPDEQGLTWGGNVDEFATLDGYPSLLCPVDSMAAKNIIGVSGHLFAETIRDFAQVQRYLFPKMLGLAERGWNADTTYSHADFNRVIADRELPSMAIRGMDFHLRQPGIKACDGVIMMNSPYNGAEIRYTLDGSNPKPDSPLYAAPIVDDGTSSVRASLFYHGRKSVPTILIRKKDEHNNQ